MNVATPLLSVIVRSMLSMMFLVLRGKMLRPAAGPAEHSLVLRGKMLQLVSCTGSQREREEQDRDMIRSILYGWLCIGRRR